MSNGPAVVDMGFGVRRLRAGNPSPMTLDGTNTYVVGRGEVAVIDPGPDDAAHLAVILKALKGEVISHILVTHAHLDHSPLATRLSVATGAPVLAFGDARAGRSDIMTRLARKGFTRGGEGVDAGFMPDVELDDGSVIEGRDWRIEALWTPGHFGNHMCFALGPVVFSGDLVMGWASSLVSPPDGDVSDFMASCRRLAARAPEILLPGHGDPVKDPAARIAWLIAHREERERQVLEALGAGQADINALTRTLYAETPPELHPAAARNVFAHLVDLHQRGLVTARPQLGPDAIFERC